MNLFYKLALIFILSIGAGGSLLTATADLPDDWEAFVLNAMNEWKVPGVAVAVVKDGEIILAAGYGVRRAGSNEPVDEQTLFAIGSTTKAFTTAALGAMVDAGKTSWDTPVHAIKPDLRWSDSWVEQEIRLSDLMACHSGLSAVSESLWYGTTLTRRDILDALAKVPFDESFRYTFQYRNVPFLVAGELLPALHGKSWEDTIVETFFEPLGMSRSFPTQKGIEQRDNVAQPHVIDYAGAPRAIPYRDMTNIAPAGSIVSCVQDLIPWMLLHLQEGSYQDKQILQPVTVKTLHAPQTPMNTFGPEGDPLVPPVELRAYALGWIAESYQGQRLIWHNGGIDGMSAWVGLSPSLGLGVAVLSNLEHCELRQALFYKLVDFFAGNEPVDLLPHLLESYRDALSQRDAMETTWQELARDPVTPALPLARFAQIYRNPVFGQVEIVLDDGRLVYHRTPEQIIDLVPQDKNTFLGRYRNDGEDWRSGKLLLVFNTDDGSVEGFTEEDMIVFKANGTQLKE
jgi:CubicO group peptidase (beta-lactamase class C family)